MSKTRFKKTHGKKTIYVWGSGDFPMDMLRYDNCIPASSTGAASMAYRSKAERTVQLEMFISESANGPTEERWKSFGWTVIPECLAGHSKEVIEAWIGKQPFNGEF